jgi:predicted transcriptional regulator
MKEKKISVKKGQFWKENDNRYDRVVEVLKVDKVEGKVKIKTVESTFTTPGKVTIASLSRFNNKHRGYSLQQSM